MARVVLPSNDIVRVTFHLIPHLPCFAQRTAVSQCLDVGVCWKFVSTEEQYEAFGKHQSVAAASDSNIQSQWQQRLM